MRSLTAIRRYSLSLGMSVCSGACNTDYQHCRTRGVVAELICTCAIMAGTILTQRRTSSLDRVPGHTEAPGRPVQDSLPTPGCCCCCYCCCLCLLQPPQALACNTASRPTQRPISEGAQACSRRRSPAGGCPVGASSGGGGSLGSLGRRHPTCRRGEGPRRRSRIQGS